jgi:ribose transport system substrate-binding protein
MQFTKLVPASLAAIAMLALGACGDRNDGAEKAAGGSSTSAAPAAEGAKTVYTFGVIAKSQSNPVFQAAHVGALDAAAELEKQYPNVTVNIDWRTPNSENAQEQASNIEMLTSLGVDGIAVSASDAKLLKSSVDAAVAKGVTVVTFDSDVPDSARMAYYGVDDFQAGQAVMKELAREMGEEGVVAVLTGSLTAPNLAARVRGVQEELKNYPKIELRNVFSAPEQATDMVAKMQSAQTANPDITGWALVGGWPLYTDNALDGIYQTAKVVSMDPLPQPFQYVKEGQVQVLVGQPYYGWGHESVMMLFNKVHNGKAPDEVMNYAPFDIVTQENVAEFEDKWEKWLGKD